MRVAARERFAISMHRRVRLLEILKWRKPCTSGYMVAT
jgi:hypothetical protein